MHPVFRNRNWFAAYLGLWLALAVALAALLHVPGTLEWRETMALAGPLCLFFAFVCLTPWYMCRQLPLRSAGIVEMLSYHLGAAVLATALWVALARMAASALGLGARLDPVVPHLMAVGLLLYVLSVALHYMALAAEESRQAVVDAREAELRALKAQINPHFLFNCLNTIRGMIVESPAKAQEMVTRLANILRYNLRGDRAPTVPLSEEIEVVSDYLSLEAARFEDRLRVTMDIGAGAAAVPVPPMLLQTLVENALKHGIAHLPEGGEVRIEASLERDSLALRVVNSGDLAEPAPNGTRIGLKNARERLRLLYGDRATLELQAADHRVIATVRIPRL